MRAIAVSAMKTVDVLIVFILDMGCQAKALLCPSRWPNNSLGGERMNKVTAPLRPARLVPSRTGISRLFNSRYLGEHRGVDGWGAVRSNWSCPINIPLISQGNIVNIHTHLGNNHLEGTTHQQPQA
ncbi:hypothetical protein V8F06_010448 [Rhypophila decipiens]